MEPSLAEFANPQRRRSVSAVRSRRTFGRNFIILLKSSEAERWRRCYQQTTENSADARDPTPGYESRRWPFLTAKKQTVLKLSP